MKTINVTDEQYAELVKMAEQIKTQDNCCTADPIFCIYQKAKVVKPEGYGDVEAYIDEEGQIIDDDKVNDDDNFKEARAENPDLPKDAIIKSLGWRKIEYSIEDVPVVNGQYYFTSAGAKEHIRRNHYHYGEPFVYAESTWRNPELKLIREILLNLTEEKKL